MGPAIEKCFVVLGLLSPFELIGQDPYKLYDRLCTVEQKCYDPCVIDVFIASVRYMEGGEVKKWWHYTAERKTYLSAQ